MSNTVKFIWAAFLGLSVSLQFSGCSQVSLSPSGGKNKRHTLLTDSVPIAAKQPAAGHVSQPAERINVSGQWRLGFQVENRNLSSTLNLTQNGNSFQGEGIDDQTKRHFFVERGAINGSQVSFFKKYDGNDMQAVEHSGQLSILNDASADVHGPYMTGDYSTGFHGKILSGPWEAALVPADKAMPISAPPPQPEAQPISEAPPAHSNKAPDLSGKWNIGYESNFKTIHSVMYLEQEGGKLLGHGVDLDTKEKFVISKGWYHFPQITVIRSYVKGKGAKTSRTVTFKAQVSFVSDRDYQGPYLNGKTQGGGTWEGEMVK
jgi:hypothetical protein